MHRSQAHSRRFRQHSTSPVSFFSPWRSERQIDNLLHRVSRQRGLPSARVLSRVSPSTPSAMNRACHLHTTSFYLPYQRIISAVPQPSAVAKMMLARHTCFCARCDPTQSPQADSISSCDVHNNSCSHIESLKCFVDLKSSNNHSSSRLVVRRGSRELSFRGLFLRIGGDTENGTN